MTVVTSIRGSFRPSVTRFYFQMREHAVLTLAGEGRGVWLGAWKVAQRGQRGRIHLLLGVTKLYKLVGESLNY